MANASFDLGQVGVTDYLICRCRKVSAPATEVQRIVFGPAPATTNNFTFTGLDPVTHYFDLYESTNGTSLSFLFGTFTFDVKNQRLLNERRWYTAGGPGANDPAPGGTTLTDAYFNGKNISGFFQRGFGYMENTTEYSVSGTTISLLNGITFTDGDRFMVEIDYTVVDTTTISASLFAGIKTVNANATTDSSYYNKRILLNGVGSQLVITLDDYVNIPDGKFFYFVDNNGGTQKQTKIIASTGSILYNGISLPEIWVGKGEWIWIEKNGAFFEVIQSHANLQLVGQRFAGRTKTHPNTLPEDGAPYLAADYPRIWYWLNHGLITNEVVLDNAMTSGAYTRPANKDGQFIISITNGVFRMPNTQNLSEKGLANFNTYNTDATRSYDYPGGKQPAMVGPHQHPGDDIQSAGATDANKVFVKRKNGGPGGGFGLNNAGGGFELTAQFTGKNLDGSGNITTDNVVANFGVIYLTHV